MFIVLHVEDSSEHDVRVFDIGTNYELINFLTNNRVEFVGFDFVGEIDREIKQEKQRNIDRVKEKIGKHKDAIGGVSGLD